MYDPELDLVYWGTGNPAPWASQTRPGDVPRLGGACLLLACHDLIMGFLLRCSHSIFSILSANRQVGELFGEWLSEGAKQSWRDQPVQVRPK